MLAGKVPFDSENAVSVALMQVQANAQKLTQINPDIPKGLEQICVHAMQKNPRDRYQTATEMLLDIEEVIKNPNTTFNYSNNNETFTSTVVEPPHQIDDEYDEVIDPQEAEGRKKKTIAAVVISVIVLIGVIIGVVFMFTSGMNAKSQKLESFVGFSYDELQNDTSYDYQFVAEYRKTNDQEPGIIISQSPEAGSRVTKGSTVTLIVAASEKDISVTNVYGLSLELAQETLKQDGLTIFKTMKVSSESVEEGKVVYTDPKAGTIVSSDQEITIFISDGPSTTTVETIKVPDVTGLTQSGAKAFLEKYGFKNVTFTTQDSVLKKGIVISQSPGAGTSVKETDTIKVIISTGETTTAPRNVTYSFDIVLPNVEGTNDTLVVKVNGETYSSKNVNINGKTIKVSVSCEGEKQSSIQIMLSKAGYMETFSVDGKEDKSYTVDFSNANAEGTD